MFFFNFGEMKNLCHYFKHSMYYLENIISRAVPSFTYLFSL